ncbi:MAG: U32 family peptidase [Deltaproteobacteria bacterium]|nr:U32 family peptidase [Deltaproteobacteria bacterium]
MLSSRSSVPELLAPVGNFEAFLAALEAGADAVYLGLRKFSARARAENFTLADLGLLVPFAHRRGVRIYLALNTLVRPEELSEIYDLLNALVELGIDAVIVQDFGLIRILARDFPELEIHVSTQAAIHNLAALKELARQGCKRVVLGRELSLEEIAGLAAESPLEIEYFVFGALCVSVAGLCQFSSFYNAASANRGRCSQPCRRNYRLGGEEGSYFSPADFSALEFLPELVEAGIVSCKIEGRMKGSQYVSVVVGVFRQALDLIASEGRFPPGRLKELKAELKKAYTRPTTTANLSGRYPANIIEPRRSAGMGEVIGKVRRVVREGRGYRVFLRTFRPPEIGDRLKLMRSGRDGRDNSLTLKKGEFTLEKRGGGGFLLSLRVPFSCRTGDLLLKVGRRDDSGRTGSAAIRRRIAAEVRSGNSSPAVENTGKAGGQCCRRQPPRNWFAAVSVFPGGGDEPRSGWLIKLADFDLVRPFLARRGWRVALELDGARLSRIENRERELFRRFSALEWSLPPLQYPGREERLAGQVRRLLKAGFRRFHLNSLGQLEYFRVGAGTFPPDLELATGPFLHAANPAALAFYADLGFGTVHLTPEVDRDLCRRLDCGPVRPALMLFGYIPLLLTRIPLSHPRRGAAFLSRRNEEIRLLKRDGLSILVSPTPFSLLDLSGPELALPGPVLKVVDLVYSPDSAIARRFLKSRTPRMADVEISTYNFSGLWR